VSGLGAQQLVALRGVLDEVAEERARQHAKWGEQNLPNGTGREWAADAQEAREECDRAFSRGFGEWAHVLKEEVYEAFAEDVPERLRAELIQVAAVAVAWVEALDRRAQRASLKAS
jgi:hypothetical protein